jgi:hypothetical protein
MNELKKRPRVWQLKVFKAQSGGALLVDGGVE